MPFGLTNAPAVFQALRDILNKFVFVYLDDIQIFSTSVETHRVHMRAVLQRLWENRLSVKAEKCVFHAQTLGFLGFRVAPGRLEADPEKIKAVKEWPTPNTRRRLQQFLGFAKFYRRFIRDYSRIAAPLTRLTSPKQPFKWDSAAEEAFCLLKTSFSTHPILVQPDRKK